MDDEGKTCIDRISELPDFILHHMLSYLSTKQAAQMGVVSKRWKYVWETFPILDCSQEHFGEHLCLTNPKEGELPKDERRKVFIQRIKFMSYADKKLLRFHEEKLGVNKFILHITLVSKVLAPRVDTWMEMVAKRSIQELTVCISTGKGRLHDLSKILFTMESLTVLHLDGSILLSSPPDSKAVKLCSLVELHLYYVSIDEDTIQDLISSIQSMKVLSLWECLNFENLDICGHDKLEKVAYRPCIDFKAKRFSIKVPTLKELELTFRNDGEETMVCEIIVSSVCQNLKRLSLRDIPVDAKWLQSMIKSFPLLEHLCLAGCMLQEVIKLSSQSLKEICFQDCMKLVEAEFDTPNLQSFKYSGKNIPRFYLSSVAEYRAAEFSAHFKDMDSLWFTRLCNFLRYFKFQDLTVVMFSIPGKEISFNAKDYTGIQFPHFELNNMKLVMHMLWMTSINYASLLDSLFWNLLLGLCYSSLFLFLLKF
ncbi:putative F-box/LRR-repeat protein At5g02700 [Chenopodium quinoa]|uniref:putative F-box/LRR-repeat protein At5g02700 n=1 Tax=Chenopodium quinoa TaxID=63459 RepID=UPI000B778C33|nr:putative F-box/LRR-repeat protein At5g02700 [Chenopodium quinoa]XP_021755136.1 putative F-box/LRR-repeat protein At5g02700 [Chenopodium quinoa]